MSEARLRALVRDIAARFAPATLASSLSVEDMVLTHIIARERLPIEIFVLDTGRLHADTLELLSLIKKTYVVDLKVYTPEPHAVAEYVSRHGRDAFYADVGLRQRCCEIRKVHPLRRALAGKRAWITGQRREHAPTRAALPLQEYDAVHRLEKFNPLAEWTELQVWSYLREHGIPYNRLYDQGYRSIGCAPCTRPVLPHENVREGRWWWEAADKKECGLHVAKPREQADAR